MTRNARRFVIIALAALFAGAAAAEVLSVTSTAGVTIAANGTTRTDVTVGNDYGGVEYRGLIQFSLPAFAGEVVSASLRLCKREEAAIYNYINIGVYRVTRAWDPNTVSWTQAESGVNWTGAGGDVASPAVDSVYVGADNTWYTWDVTAAVRHWRQHPAENYGLQVKDGWRWIFFDGNDYRGGAYSPALTIEYSPPSGTVIVVR